MTPKFEEPTSGSEQVNGAIHVGLCEVCGHDWPSHDATGVRFCRVSNDRALDRGCICRVNEAPRPSGTPMYGRGRFSGR